MTAGKNLILAGLIGAMLLVAFEASAFTMDPNGSLDEWGVQPDVYGSSQWTPNAGIIYSVEDTSPGDWYVSPGGGDQPFDVEAMYLTMDSTNLYFAVVTGFPPDGANGNIAGDLAFDFGINGNYERGISALTRNGFTQGNLYAVSAWNAGFWGWADPLSDPTSMLTGSAVSGGVGTLVYNNSAGYPGDHYVIEGYMPISAFGSDWGQDFRMHWAMSCGNDYLYVDHNGTPVIPEPATMSLLGLGLFGLLGFRRKKRV